MIKRLTAATALLLCFASTANAVCSGTSNLDAVIGDARAEFEAKADAFAYGDGRYWEVTKGGKRSVLIGTYHLADPRTAFISPAMKREIEAASVLMLEVTEAEKTKMQSDLAANPEQILNLEGPRLKDHLSAAEWNELVARAQEVGIPPAMVNIMQPWFLGVSLAMPPCALADAKAGVKGLDALIEAAATEAGLRVEGLETFGELFGLLSMGSFEENVEQLKIWLSMTASDPDDFEAMVELYIQDRIADIWAFSEFKLRAALGPKEAERQLALAFDLLLKQRNQNWLDTLLPTLEQGNAVVAVGAMHLVSDDGLLAILEREGYIIKRLSLVP